VVHSKPTFVSTKDGLPLLSVSSVALCPFCAHNVTVLLRADLPGEHATFLVTLMWPRNGLTSPARKRQLASLAADSQSARRELRELVMVPAFHSRHADVLVDEVYTSGSPPGALPVATLVATDGALSRHAAWASDIACILKRICARRNRQRRATNFEVCLGIRKIGLTVVQIIT